MSFYGADFAAQRRNRHDQYLTALQRILAKRQGASQAYASGSSKLDIEKPNALRNVLNTHASRGMAYSSGYGQEVQKTNTDFADRLSQLASQRNATNAEADLDESDVTSSYNYDISDYQAQQAQYEAEQQQALVASQASQQPAQTTGGTAGVAAARQTSTITRSQFLANNPGFAQMGHDARQVWLRNHPDAAKVWARVNS